MKPSRLLPAGIAALGVFGLGYLVGQSAKKESAGDVSSSPAGRRQAGHGHESSSSDGRSATKSKRRSANPVPSPDKAFSRRVVEMMSAGELSVSGVEIAGDTLQPGDKVKEFLDLSDEQLETMKHMGRERLQTKQEHEQSITTILEASEQEIVFDVPADVAFAEREKAAFTEEIRKEFGPDVAAVLQASIGQAYREFENPRHVSYSIAPASEPVPDNAPPEIRSMLEGTRNFRIRVNQNEDGSFMKDERGMFLPGGHGSTGTVNVNAPGSDAWLPRYHYLWKQEKPLGK